MVVVVGRLMPAAVVTAMLRRHVIADSSVSRSVVVVEADRLRCPGGAASAAQATLATRQLAEVVVGVGDGGPGGQVIAGASPLRPRS